MQNLIKPSTKSFIKEARDKENYSFMDWLHGYIYGRWPYFYIGVGTGEHRLTKTMLPLVQFVLKHFPHRFDDLPAGEKISFADTYHGKVVPTEHAKKLVNMDQEINLQDLEQVIPYKTARDIVLKNPDHIVALECPCRSVREDPCKPLDVCLIVGEPFAGFIMEHSPDKARWISQDEASTILDQERDRGHVHHAFFKDAMLGKFYAICNCCSCCCGAMQARRNGTPMLASSGYVAETDREKCIGCGECVDSCQFDALKLGEDEIILLDEMKCMGCGVCVEKCSEDVHCLVAAPERGIPLDIHELMRSAASPVN